MISSAFIIWFVDNLKIDTVLIGNRIRRARLLRNMTADSLADMIGIAAVTLRHIETGANNASLHTIINIAETLNVSIDYLLGRVSSPVETKSLSLKETYGLTVYQEKMLMDMIENLIPIVTEYA